MQDLTDHKYGRLTVVSYYGRRGGHHAWNCTCECGGAAVVIGSNLRRGNTSSCGCLHREVTGDVHRTHGMTRSTEYHIYSSMLARCYNPKSISFPRYGARGVSVCDRWRLGDGELTGFECFLADMGHRPSKSHSLDRKNNDGNYELSNVRWATKKEQHRNTRRNRFIEFRGRTMVVGDAAALVGLKRTTVLARILKGWSVEDALTVAPRG